MPLGTHSAVGQYLRDGVFGCWRLLGLISVAQRADIIHGVEVTDILQRVGDALDQISIADDYGHIGPCILDTPIH